MTGDCLMYVMHNDATGDMAAFQAYSLDEAYTRMVTFWDTPYYIPGCIRLLATCTTLVPDMTNYLITEHC